MKIGIMKYSLLFMLVPFLAFAGVKGEKLNKEIKREFSIQTNGMLNIDNKYGAVDITTGPSNQISIQVVITAEASNKSKAQEALDRVSILFKEEANKVFAATHVESPSGFKSWFSSDNMNVEINFTVVVPADIYLKLMNKYGSVYVETTDRDLEIDLAYGDIRLGDINGNLNLDMAYSEGSISNIKSGRIALGYSEFEMEDAASVDIRMQYSELAMGTVGSAKIDASYSDLKSGQIGSLSYTGKYADVSIESVKVIEAKGAYTDIEIGSLGTSGSIAMTYGDLEIEKIGAGLAVVEINTAYTDVSLDFQGVSGYSIEAKVSYGDIKHNNLKVVEDVDNGTSSSFKATNGSGGGKVVLKMAYGDLRIN
jgi:hypothetical protein